MHKNNHVFAVSCPCPFTGYLVRYAIITSLETDTHAALLY